MHEADAHPVRHQARGALADLGEPAAYSACAGAPASCGKSRAMVKSTSAQQRESPREAAARSGRSAGTTARRGTRSRPGSAADGRRRTCRAPRARRWRPGSARAWSARRGGASPRCTGTRGSTSAAPRGRRRVREYGVGPAPLSCSSQRCPAAPTTASPSEIARPSPSCPAQWPNWWPQAQTGTGKTAAFALPILAGWT
jgi:hypothetical protein